MAKKHTDTVLVKTAVRLGRTLGRAARGVDTVKTTARTLASGVRRKAGTKKAVKKAARPGAGTASKPPSSRKSRTEATAAALQSRQGTAVDERALARSMAAGSRWSNRKPR